MGKVRPGSRIAPLMLGIAFCALVLGFFIGPTRVDPRSESRTSGIIFAVASGIWIFLFIMYRAKRKSIKCVECGRTILPGQAPKGQSVCPLCQGRQLNPVAHRKSKRKTLIVALACYAYFSLFFGFLVSVILVHEADWELGRAAAVSALVLAVLIPAALVLFFLCVFFWIKSLQSTKRLTARARRCAKEYGETAQLGPHLVWYAGEVDPLPVLTEQRELSQSRIEALVGETTDEEKPLRIFVFNRRSDFENFLRPFFSHGWNFDGVSYLSRTLVFSTEDVASYVVDFEASMRTLFGTAFLERRFPATIPWIQVGLARFVSHPEDDEARRLDRKMTAALASGTACGTELFALQPGRMASLVRNWYDQKSFRELMQIHFQAESMFRCLITGGNSPERLAALRGFLGDLKEGGKIEERFASRFGFDHAEFLDRWKHAIQSQGPGSHAASPRRIVEKIQNTIGPFVTDPRQPLMDRIVAIRDLGIGGRIEGADTLIELLRSPESDVPEAEIVWALEAISGRVLGPDPEAWATWLEDQDIRSRANA